MEARGVLTGFRVIALTQVWAGPLVARYLADLGADTIKIETTARPDLIRSLMLPANDTTPRSFDHSGYYHTFNRNHRGMALDLGQDSGRDVFRRLVRDADVLVENFSPRVMANWGLGYEQLSRVNPRLVMVSLSGFGATGPYRDYVAYGNSIDPMTGLIDMTGYEGGPPVRSALSYPDPIAATQAAFACLAALYERETSGAGQFIDVSMLEAATANIGEAIAEFDADGVQPGRIGNQSPAAAPCGVYRCLGDDQWVALSVATDEEWRSLCNTIGCGDLGADEGLGTLEARKRREPEIDDAVTAWAAGRTKFEAMHTLQSTGVAAGAVLTNEELLASDQLRSREFFLRLTYEDGHEFEHPGFPFRLSETSLSLRSRGPGLGEHNREILAELGYAPAEIDELVRRGVIGDTPSLPAAG